MKLLLTFLLLLLLLNVYAGDCVNEDTCGCQRKSNMFLSRNESFLSKEETADFIKKCLTCKTLAEIVLEYESRLIDKYGDSAKAKIYLTAAAAMIPVSKEGLNDISISHLSLWNFIHLFALMHGCKVIIQGDAFVIDIKDWESKGCEAGATDKHDNLKYKTTGVRDDELPQNIFVIREDTITQSYSVIVMDDKQFKDVESGLAYINKLPPARLKNGILFRFGSKVEYKLSKDLFGKILDLAKKENIPFYSLVPRGAGFIDDKIFKKYIFE